MKIESINLNNFMLFESADLEFSPNINIICGDNNTGKTVLIKILYSILQACRMLPENASKKETELIFARKLQGVFRPDQNNIGRLVSRKRGRNKSEIRVGFGNLH